MNIIFFVDLFKCWLKWKCCGCLYVVVYFICRVKSAHWSLKRLLQNSVGDICSVWEAMNNMMTLQYTQIRASFETSTHVVGHVFKITLYKKITRHGFKVHFKWNYCWVWVCVPYAYKTLHIVDVSSGLPTIFHVYVSCLNMLLVLYH